jgi:thiamine pyrophosphate-dependent acetolactate synthase large subunit-like protein
VKRSDCLQILATLANGEMLTVTSQSGRTGGPWRRINKAAANFPGLNLGLCVPFALGMALAFPDRKVIALDSDGSLLLDTSSLVTVADAGARNLVILVFDNQAYARMGPTATARGADIEKIAQGAGIPSTETVRSLEAFETTVRRALGAPGPSVVVAKVETEAERGDSAATRPPGRSARDLYVEAVQGLPDHWGMRGRGLTRG